MKKSILFPFFCVVGIVLCEIAFADGKNRCPVDSVEVGSWCVDRFEASIWETTHRGTINRIKAGNITSARFLNRKAIRRGDGTDDYDIAGCPNSGNGCTTLYAASIKGVRPSNFVTWMQATAACRNAGKELLPNQIWQAAALGTPDPGDNGDGMNTCATNTLGPVPTGTTGDCISDTGAYDTVGNVEEYVADWAPRTDGCVTPLFGSGDLNCYAAANRPSVGGPGVLTRGGQFNGRTAAGVFTFVAFRYLGSPEVDHIGFRCGRPRASRR